MEERKIAEDDATIEVPRIDIKDRYLLNSQTAYNKSLVDASRKCGCFHCGSTFEKEEIRDWMHEKDGEDTALCPYCRTDSVIVGTEDLPLSTSLLSKLYIEWFPNEYKELRNNATEIPTFADYDDFLRKGAPFQLKNRGEEFVGDVGLWCNSVFNSMWNEEFDDTTPVDEDEVLASNSGGVVSAKAYFEEDGHYRCEIKSQEGQPLPYEPWSGTHQELLIELTKEYGDKLKGIIIDGGFGSTMRLFVEK